MEDYCILSHLEAENKLEILENLESNWDLKIPPRKSGKSGIHMKKKEKTLEFKIFR